jgi:hypothetical protein
MYKPGYLSFFFFHWKYNGWSFRCWEHISICFLLRMHPGVSFLPWLHTDTFPYIANAPRYFSLYRECTKNFPFITNASGCHWMNVYAPESFLYIVDTSQWPVLYRRRSVLLIPL